LRAGEVVQGQLLTAGAGISKTLDHVLGQLHRLTLLGRLATLNRRLRCAGWTGLSSVSTTVTAVTTVSSSLWSAC
jgi:hypothetical protein